MHFYDVDSIPKGFDLFLVSHLCNRISSKQIKNQKKILNKNPLK